jgi:NADH dehydrogenase
MKKTIVIIGAGFAGVDCARHLRSRLPHDWDIVLISRENHLVFTPLIAEVVGASINPLHVVWPVRQMVRGVSCRTAIVSQIELRTRQVHYQPLGGRTALQTYDHLVLACGMTTNLDILPGMAAHGWPLKTLGDALALRNHVIGQLERAEVESVPAARQRLLSFVVVGGGFSGVEVAGEIHDLVQASLRFYRSIPRNEIRVRLLQAGERILLELPASLSEFATRKMQKRGIEVRVNVSVQAVTELGVRLKAGEELLAGTVVSTIGNATHPLIASLGLPLDRGRLRVEPDMRVIGQSQLWAIGDCAAVPNAVDQMTAPPTAQFAVRQAKQLAKNLVRTIRGEATVPFAFKTQGMFASIGHRTAVGQVYGAKLSGFPAWFFWRALYLAKMPTLARKVQIAFDWAWELLFPRDLVQLNLARTERLGRAHFETGQFVFRSGDPADRFYIIEHGRAGVYRDETQPAIAFLGPGDHFGERALLRGSKHTAAVKAEEPLDVLLIEQHSFADLIKNLEGLRRLMETTVRQIQASDEFVLSARDHPLLSTLRACDAMSGPVATLPMRLSIEEALQRSRQGGRGAYPVVDDAGRMVGLCTRSDFYKAVRRLLPPATPLTEIMTKPVITAKESDTLASVVLQFLKHPIKRVVVVDHLDSARPVGILTPFDILPIIGVKR